MGVNTFISIRKNEANILTSFFQALSLICRIDLANKDWFCSLEQMSVHGRRFPSMG